VSIDAYRGLVMFLMMAEVLHLSGISRHFPDNAVWRAIGFNTQHVEWTGFSLHDLIQPSFSFLVGVALPFSIASRVARGKSFGMMLGHAMWRAFLLIALGVFLRSIGRPQTYFSFVDTLSQIGLGYTFLFLLAFVSLRWQVLALAGILVGYWALFAVYPLPGPDFVYPMVPANWPHHLSGFVAHWDKNSNPAWAFDTWFLNLFPREQPFTANGGGYATLSFIPTLGTMILGLIAGGWMRERTPASRKCLKLLSAATICLALGWLLDWSAICPSVKRIWTPAWTLFSGGWCFLFLAGFYALTDAVGWRGWVFPLTVIGMNSIAIYVLVHHNVMGGFVASALNTHLGRESFQILGRIHEPWGLLFEPLLRGAAVLLIFWLILFWMYRRKIFIKI
jgi:predicted acyltransferase